MPNDEPLRDEELGFSLAETIAALMLVAAAAMLLASAGSIGWRGLYRAESADRGVETARALLATVGIERTLAVGRSEGRDSDGWHWVIEIEPYVPPSAMPARVRAEAFRVTVTVGGAGPETRLSTVKLGGAP